MTLLSCKKCRVIHNISNALAAIGASLDFGVTFEQIADGLSTFYGTDRRFQYKGEVGGVTVIDDYAHHPTEILATAQALKNKKHRQSWVVFQPHTYSRTKNLLDDFATALTNFDNIIITDIYAAREKNTYNISSQDLVNKIHSLGKSAIYISSFDDISKFIRERACPHDIILTMGAGTVTEIGRKILS